MTNDANTIDLLQIKIERAKASLPEETLNAIAAVDWRAVIMGMREKKGYNFEQLGDLELKTELLLCGLLSPADYPKELEKSMGISRANANELVNEMNNLVFKKIKEELIKNAERKKIFANKLSMASANDAEMPADLPAQGAVDESVRIIPPSINKVDAEVLKSAGIEVVPARNASSIADAGGKPISANGESSAVAEKLIENREDILKKVENPELIIPKKPEPARLSASPGVDGKAVHPILQQKILGSVQTPTVKTEHTLDNITPPSYPQKRDPYRLSPDE